ncbi:MAG TPA: DUF167 domain-containing protein [Planctomycetaceae bacterium]|nr:DUF167 domain-containing protein [Planctomycetaceae bacterium]
MIAGIALEQTAEGVLLPVRAQPRAKRNGVVGTHAGRLKVAVTAAPDKGQANAALVDVLAESLGLKRSQVTLRSGATAREKVFLLSGVSLDEVRRRLARWS